MEDYTLVGTVDFAEVLERKILLGFTFMVRGRILSRHGRSAAEMVSTLFSKQFIFELIVILCVYFRRTGI